MNRYQAFVAVIAALNVSGALAAANARQKLFASLFAEYNKNVLPETNTPVTYGFMPIELELTSEGVLQGSIWERIFYTDSRLVWNPEDFDGVDALRIPAHHLWVPDITLYNRHNTEQAMNPHLQPGYYSNAVVKSDGKVYLVPETQMQAGCAETDLTDFWGEQDCTLKFGSWTYHDGLVNLTFGGDMDTTYYRKTSPVKINSYTTFREVKTYDCCPEPYVNLQYRLKLQRRFRMTEQGVIWNPLLKAAEEEDESAAEEVNEEGEGVTSNDI